MKPEKTMKLISSSGRISFRMRVCLFVIALAVMSGEARAQVPQPPRYTVTALSSLGGTFTEANGISTRDWIAGYSNLPGDQYQHATLWRSGMLTDLGTLGGYNSFIFFPVKDEAGFIVGGSETSATDPLGENFCGYGTGLICAGFVWRNGAMTALPTLGGNNGAAINVNNRGQITGYAEIGTADPRCIAPQVLLYEAVVWWPQPGKIQELPPFPGDLTAVGTAINDAGQVAGASAPGCTSVGNVSRDRAVLWDHGSVIDLGNLGGDFNLPFAINNRGQVVGISDVAGDVYQHAFLWTKETGMQDLGTLPGDVVANALGMNNKTQVVGGSADASNNGRAFLWANGVMTDLNTLVQPNSGLYLVAAADINDAGEITGMAVDNAGAVVGFVAVPDHQQLRSPEVAENVASTNIVFPERAHGFSRPRGLLGPRHDSNQPVLKNLGTLGDTNPIAECVGDPSFGISDKHSADADHNLLLGFCEVNRSTDKLTGVCHYPGFFTCFTAWSPQKCPPGTRPINPGYDMFCHGSVLDDHARICP